MRAALEGTPPNKELDLTVTRWQNGRVPAGQFQCSTDREEERGERPS